jgi:hypothetical protein
LQISAIEQANKTEDKLAEIGKTAKEIINACKKYQKITQEEAREKIQIQTDYFDTLI